MSWTAERTAFALARWTAGDNASEISRALAATGFRVSRNAVIGKLYRMGAPKRENPYGDRFLSKSPALAAISKQETNSSHRRRVSKPKLPKTVDRSVKGPGKAQAPAVMARIVFSDLVAGQCKFPVAGAGADMICCGNAAKPGRPYCTGHAAVCRGAPASPADVTRARARKRAGRTARQNAPMGAL